jgi:hypothetical protein
MHRRPDGSVLRPHRTIGWHWEHEIEAARRAKLIRQVRVIKWVGFWPINGPSPLAPISELYEERLRVGKKSPRGIAMKLAYNSMYGKFAQSIGTPLFANPVWASLITAGCRTMILDAIATHPNGDKALVMVATDGVYFDSPHPTLKLDSERLGSWDMTERSNLSIFKPGVYWDDKSRESVRTGAGLQIKSRGVSAAALAAEIDRIDDIWREGKVWPAVGIVTGFSMVSPKLAVARGKWDTAGLVQVNVLTVQSSYPIKKRQLSRRKGSYGTKPHYHDIELVSTPYTKSFGMDLDEPLVLLDTDLLQYEVNELLHG